MELTTTKTELLSTLSWTQTVVDRKATMPILANCCVIAEKKSLTVMATDLEVGVMVGQTANVKTPGKVTVNAKALYEIIKSLPDDNVALQVHSNHTVEIKSGKSQFKIVGMPADEYPALPKLSDAAQRVRMSADDVRSLITQTSYAMSTDETRYYLNGVLLEPIAAEGKTPARARLVATDSHRLAYADRPVHGEWNLPQGVIVPRKGVHEWRRLLDGVNGDFTLSVDTKYIAVERDSISLYIRLIDGQFPPYRQVVPKETKWTLSVARDLLMQALKRVQLVTNERIRGVKFHFAPGALTITAQNPDLGEAREELAVQYTGDSFEMGFNARFFQDVLGVITDEHVVLELKGDLSPCVIRSEFDKSFLSLVMPMRIA